MTTERELLRDAFTAPRGDQPATGITADAVIRQGRRHRLGRNLAAGAASLSVLGLVGGLALGLSGAGHPAKSAQLGAPSTSSPNGSNANEAGAEGLRSGLASVVSHGFSGSIRQGLVGYATTDTPNGPSYGRSAEVYWSDSRGAVTFVVQRSSIALSHEQVTCATATDVTNCTSSTDRDGVTTYFMSPASDADRIRSAIRVLADGSGIMITEQLGETNPNHVRGKNDGVINKRDQLVASDSQLSALLDAAASY